MLTRFAIGAFVSWTTVAVVVVLATFVVTARRDLIAQDVTTAEVAAPAPTATPSRPAGVPPEANLATQGTSFGEVSPSTGGSDGAPHIFYALTCRGQLLTIATTRETIYAEVACIRYWLPDEVVRPFLAKPVRVRVSVSSPAELVVDALGAGSARFAVGNVWIDAR